jgi:predicted transcriptional regulator
MPQIACAAGIRTCRDQLVDDFVYIGYDRRMGETTTIRISRETHARVSRLATERHETIDETVSRAIRALRQDAMARDLATELTDGETAWLDADAG